MKRLFVIGLGLLMARFCFEAGLNAGKMTIYEVDREPNGLEATDKLLNLNTEEIDMLDCSRLAKWRVKLLKYSLGK